MRGCGDKPIDPGRLFLYPIHPLLPVCCPSKYIKQSLTESDYHDNQIVLFIVFMDDIFFLLGWHSCRCEQIERNTSIYVDVSQYTKYVFSSKLPDWY